MAVRNTTDVRADLGGGAGAGKVVVVCLCAAWCDSCRAFRTTYDAIAAADPASLYVWLDVEDEALVADVDIEEFPTLAVYRGERLVHYGVSLPQRANVTRLIEAAAARAEAPPNAPDAIVRLVRALASDLRAEDD